MSETKEYKGYVDDSDSDTNTYDMSSDNESDENEEDDESDSESESEKEEVLYETDDEFIAEQCNDKYLVKSIHCNILKNKYIAIQQIGRGSYARIWLALNYENKEYYAIKTFTSNDYDDGKKEISQLKLLKNINNENIIKMYDRFEHESPLDDRYNYICIVQELMAASMYKICKNNYKLKANNVKTIFKQLLNAVETLHNNGLVHLDIKPENVLLKGRSEYVNNIISKIDKSKLMNKNKKKKLKQQEVDKIIQDSIAVSFEEKNNILKKTIVNEQNTELDNDKKKKTKIKEFKEETEEDEIDLNFKYIINNKLIENPQVVLCDFSDCIKINKDYIDKDIKYKGIVKTDYYIPPEQILKYKINNEKADIWSLACTLYEIITGEILFNTYSENEKLSTYDVLLQNMQNMLGPFETEYINNCNKQCLFFMNKTFTNTENGESKSYNILKDSEVIEVRNIADSISNNISDITSNENILLVDLLYKMLNYYPENRLTAQECLQHDYFKEIV